MNGPPAESLKYSDCLPEVTPFGSLLTGQQRSIRYNVGLLLAAALPPVARCDLARVIQVVRVGKDTHRARAVVLSMGAEPRRLGIPGELELGGHGVSTCGVCDGAFFKGEDVAVIGGGDSAMEDSIFVSKFARHLTIVHRRDEFRASAIMLERARQRENIDFLTPYRPLEFVAGEDSKIASLRLEHAETGELRQLEVGGAFVAIGHLPRSELVEGQVELDEAGYVVSEEPSTRTSLAGVFAVGDLVDHTYRQAVTAAGSGCKGALDAEWYLRDTPPAQPPGEARETEAEPTAAVEAGS